MDQGMGTSLSTKKIDRSNFASRSYKMHQYLLGHGYGSYVEGANGVSTDSTHKDFLAWEQSTSKVLYCFTSSFGDQLLKYIQDPKTPKEAWTNLKKVFTESTMERKLQLGQEVSNVR